MSEACLTAKEAAEYLKVSAAQVVAWIEAGHIRAFVAPGHSPGDGLRGIKHYRILASDWKSFVVGRLMTGRVEPPPSPDAPASRAACVGIDGVDRRKRTRARR